MLKKPIVAAILCVIVVISSTVISTHARLDSWCEEIRDVFFVSDGIADQLEKVCAASAGICKMAETYGIDSFEAQDLCESLRTTTHLNSPHTLFTVYQMLCGRINDLTASLKLKDLNAKDAANLNLLLDELSAARSAIGNDAYNNSVSLFLRTELGSFSAGFAKLCGVKIPEQFA